MYLSADKLVFQQLVRNPIRVNKVALHIRRPIERNARFVEANNVWKVNIKLDNPHYFRY